MALPEANLEELAALSDNELYLMLGREMSRGAGVPQSLGSLVDIGKRAFADLQGNLQLAVCGANGPRKGLKDLTQTGLLNAIATAIVSSQQLNLPQVAALYAAVLVARTGLEMFCQGFVAPPDS